MRFWQGGWGRVPRKADEEEGPLRLQRRGREDGEPGPVSFVDGVDDSYFQVGCGVRQFDTTTGEQLSSAFCFPYIPVGR